MKKILVIGAATILSACVKDVQEKTYQMMEQLRILEKICTHQSKSTVKKFTGSNSSIIVNCDNKKDSEEENRENFLLKNGWIERRRSEHSTLYCLSSSGISLLTTRDDAKQNLQIILRYPTVNC